MKLTITKQFTFEAAHFLTDYDGDCSRMHGHTYILDVTVASVYPPRADMVIDFKDLKDIVNQKIITKVDHQVLNDVLGFRTTAENIVRWIFKTLEEDLPSLCVLDRVRLWETPTSYTEISI